MMIGIREGRLALVVVTLLPLLAGCGGEAGNAAEGAPAAVAREINVVVEEVVPGDFTEEISLTGTSLAARDVIVSAEEGGVIRELLVEKGATVAEGAAIARIDDSVLRPQVVRARAEAALAEESWQRRKRLFEEDQVGSELAYLEARLLSEQAAAQLAVMEERLLRTVVRAPFGGVVEDRLVEIGSMVSPGSQVARIIDLDPVKVSIGVPERYAQDIRTGTRVQLFFDALEGRTFDGRISYVGTAVNPQNRTFPVELSISNTNGSIKPEMVANVSIVRRSVSDALSVPRDAVVRVSDGSAVFVVKREGDVEVVEARAVTLGLSQANRVTVTSGLEAGDRVIVVGQQLVANGDQVRVVEN